MNKKNKLVILVTIICLGLASLFICLPTFATDTESSHITETALLGNLKDDGSACGVFTILNMVVDIFSIGVGILAAIGITIVGIKYQTAGGNEEQTRKAKHRMLQIVIGIAAYALIYAGAQFLLPGGKLDFTKRCETISDEELARIKAEEKAERDKLAEMLNGSGSSGTSSQSSSSSSGGSSGGSSSSGSSSSSSSSDLSKWYTAMEQQAAYMKDAKYGSNYQSNFKKSKTDGTCITYVSTSLQRLGVIQKNKYIYYSCGMSGTAKSYIKKHTEIFSVSYPKKTVKQLNKEGKIQKGDIVFYQYGSKCGEGHTMIFLGFEGGKAKFNTFGRSGMRTNVTHSDSKRKVNMLIRLKTTKGQFPYINTK